MNAFIIGNGFDLAHNMLTSYMDFHTYLLQRFPNMDEDYLYVPSLVTAPDGKEIVSYEDVASFLCYIINSADSDAWKDFENALGKIDLLECFDDLQEVYDKDGDRNLWHEVYNNEDRTADLSFVIPYIKVLFSDWIENVELSNNVLEGFLKIIDPENDLFISFNYTHTLEKLYRCKNVIHMHGEVGKEIIFGHNGTMDYSEKNPSVPIGCYDSLQYIYDELRKDTDTVINKHFNELKAVTNCENIYSYGFSYSDVDMPYVKAICGLVKNAKTNWIFNNYDKKQIGNYKKVLLGNGFTGEIAMFSI